MNITPIENTILPVNHDVTVRSDLTVRHISAVTLPPYSVHPSTKCTTSTDEIEGEIRALAKTCGNTRVAAKFRMDRKKIVGFLSQIAQVAWSEHATLPGDGAESAVHASCTFVRTVEELSALSGELQPRGRQVHALGR